MREYEVILADPPWSFKTYSGSGQTPHRSANDHYDTMEYASLAEIPVSQWAAKDCALFMWVVDSHIPEAIKLIEAWGFKYKTIAFTWVKLAKNGEPRVGMGYWTRKQSEICLLATKGKPRRVSKAVRQVIMAPRREHSRKPDEQYDRIEALVGSDGKKLEMFARQSWPGWDSWGNETDKFSGKDQDGNSSKLGPDGSRGSEVFGDCQAIRGDQEQGCRRDLPIPQSGRGANPAREENEGQEASQQETKTFRQEWRDGGRQAYAASTGSEG